MKKFRIVVHLGLDRNNEVKCHLVQTCGQLIPFWGSFELMERHLTPSYWIGGTPWGTYRSLQEWKDISKKVDRVVRFQRVTYIQDVN